MKSRFPGITSTAVPDSTSFASASSTRRASPSSIFAGPIFMSAREKNIDTQFDFDDNAVGGGFVGAVHRVRDGLVLGFGLSVIDQYQDNARTFPIFIVNWEITGDLRLATSTEGGMYPSLELIFDYDQNKEVAVGVSYRYSRFRLDNDGLAPGGVGQVTDRAE